jgi:protein-tyrosine kinase
MSETPTRLNLFERALRKQATHSETGLVNGATENVAMDGRPKNGSPNLQANNSHSAARVSIKMAPLRKSRIMPPDTKESITFNEYRVIKRKLLGLAEDSDTKAMTKNVFLITSALPGEGKTFSVMNLAVCLAADRDLDVVVIDGDVARATLGSYFDGPHEEGLLDLLTDEHHQIDDVLHDCVDVPNLHVMFAGKHRNVPMELFAGRRMAELCDTLSKRYPHSIVLIDTPPVLVTSDIVALAGDVDHVIMVVSAGLASPRQVEEALEIVAKCPSITLLFNKAPEWQRPASQSYYYSYLKRS